MKVDQVKTLFYSLESDIRLVSLMVCQKIFKTLPPLFTEIYIIHVMKFNAIISLFHVLINDKLSLYVHIFNELNKSHPSTIVTE